MDEEEGMDSSEHGVKPGGKSSVVMVIPGDANAHPAKQAPAAP